MSVLNRTTGRLAKAAAVGALGAAVVLGAAGCGAGKISQTNNQLAAVTGVSGSITLRPDQGSELAVGTIALRNVQIVHPRVNADKAFAEGGPFSVSFSISNDTELRKIKLIDVVGPAGSSVTITPPAESKTTTATSAPASTPTSSQAPTSEDTDPEDSDNQNVTVDTDLVGPGQTLLAGVQANVETAAAEAAGISRWTVTLNNAGNNVRPGLNVPLTFKFEVLDLTGKHVENVQTTLHTPVDDGTLQQNVDVIRDPQAHMEGSEGEGEH